jgi:glyoxylase-like metal-dependent hydrolase (beta-lactamase superfamily II)
MKKHLLALGVLWSVLGLAKPLELKVYTSDGNGFLVTSTLLTGEKEAILVDAQFNASNAYRVVADVLESGKKLTMIYVSHAHPDHYFGLEIVKRAFPGAKVVATKATVAEMKGTAKKKLAFWGPQLGANAPTKIVMPEALKKDQLDLEGQVIEVMTLAGDSANNTALWIAEQKALIAGDIVYGGVHVWTADSNADGRKSWAASLDKLSALKPETVVPGHYLPGTPKDASAIAHTKQYLQVFDEELPKAKDAATLITSMKSKFPNDGLLPALEIGAKVNKGEMKW